MRTILAALAALMLTAGAGEARTACHETPSAARAGKNIYVQYRLIAGKKCWYPGEDRKEKSALFWRAGTGPSPVAKSKAPDFPLVMKLEALCGGACPDFTEKPRAAIPHARPLSFFDEAFSHTYSPIDWRLYVKP